MSHPAKLVVFVHPASDGDEAEFNRWFDEVHIPQVIERVPGFVRAHRFRLSDAQVHPSEELPARRYLNVWDLETDDLQDAANRLAAAIEDGTLDMTETIDVRERPPLLHYYEPVERRGGAGA